MPQLLALHQTSVSGQSAQAVSLVVVLLNEEIL